MFCLFQEKGQYKNDYYQLSQFRIRYLYLARAYLWAIDYGFDTCNQPGYICWRLIPDSIPVSSQGTSEEFEDSIPVSNQGISVDD